MSSSSYGPNICTNPAVALKKEWKEKNDVGVLASSTILGTNTRLSHGLFSLSTDTGDQAILLAGLDEVLFIGDRPYPLSSHCFSNTIYPKGYLNLEYFYCMPFPTWIYRAEGLALVKMVIVLQGERTVLIRYQFLSSYGDFVRLQVRPIVAFRKVNEFVEESPDRVPDIKTSQGVIELIPKNKMQPIYLTHNAGVVDREGLWLRKLSYAKQEKEEDLYSPCSLLYAFLKEDGVYLAISTSELKNLDPFLIGVKEKGRRVNSPKSNP